MLRTFGTWVPIAVYLGVAGLVSTIAAVMMRETRGIDLAYLDKQHTPEIGANRE